MSVRCLLANLRSYRGNSFFIRWKSVKRLWKMWIKKKHPANFCQPRILRMVLRAGSRTILHGGQPKKKVSGESWTRLTPTRLRMETAPDGRSCCGVHQQTSCRRTVNLQRATRTDGRPPPARFSGCWTRFFHGEMTNNSERQAAARPPRYTDSPYHNGATTD